MKSILIAGVGNLFHGDDAFGCQVVRKLKPSNFPPAVTVTDFGIRCYDLAYALANGYDATILVDAIRRDEKPGTIYLIEPDLDRLGELKETTADAHALNPVAVLRLAQLFGPISGKLFLVGCEPAVLESDEMTLSEPVRAALPSAIQMIQSLVAELLLESQTGTEPGLT